jgi:hypothetical protein
MNRNDNQKVLYKAKISKPPTDRIKNIYDKRKNSVVIDGKSKSFQHVAVLDMDFTISILYVVFLILNVICSLCFKKCQLYDLRTEKIKLTILYHLTPD